MKRLLYSQISRAGERPYHRESHRKAPVRRQRERGKM